MKRHKILNCILVGSVIVCLILYAYISIHMDIPFSTGQQHNNNEIVIMGKTCSDLKLIYVWLVMLILFQVASRLIYSQSSQTRRDMLQEDQIERNSYTLSLILWESLSFFVWMVSIVIITTDSVYSLMCLFVGQIIGNLLILYLQEEDHHADTFM